MEEPRPSRGSGSKRTRKRGKVSRFVQSKAWKLEQCLEWDEILDFLVTFGPRLPDRSLFKKFLWKIVDGLRKEHCSLNTEDMEQCSLKSQLWTEDTEDPEMQRALDLIPESMLEKLVIEVRELLSSVSEKCSARQDIAASSGDSFTDSTQHGQDALLPDSDEAV